MPSLITQLILVATVLLVVLLLVRLIRFVVRLVRRRSSGPQDTTPKATAPPVVPVSPPRPVAPQQAVSQPVARTRETTPVAPAGTVTASTASFRRIEADELPFTDTSDYSYGPITPVLASLLPESAEKKVRVKRILQNAGQFTPHAWHNFAATRYLGVILPIIFFGVLLLIVPPRLEGIVLAAMVGFPIIGYALPGLMLQGQASKRLKEIEQGLPDMLDMLNMCVSQGMTLPAALDRVSRELATVYPPLSQELKIVSEQARIAGLPQALSNFENRVDLPDVHSFTALLIQTERMGTSVSEALAEYSDSMRESLRQRADQKANAASFKLLFPTVLCLMPAVFLFLLGPAIIQLNEFYSGESATALNQQPLDQIPTEGPGR